MLEFKKMVARLSMVCSLTLIAHTKTEAKNIPINLQEAIKIALKDNLAIQIAQNSKKESIIANNKATFQMWAPKATLKVMQRNSWQTNIAQHKLHAEPVLKLEWTFESLADQIFKTKINCQNNFIDRLVAKKTVEEILQEVVSAYYALALAQKKWELSNNFIKTATTRLKVEEEKFRLGLISKIDCLDAQLALKQVKLTLLKRQEDLKGKRRSFNLILGKPLTEETLVHSTISPQPIWNIKGITKEKIIDLKTDIASKKVALAQTKLSRAQAYPLTCLSLSGSFHSNGYIYDLKNKTSDPAKTASKWLSHIGISIDIGKLLLMPTTITKAKIALNNEKLALQQQKSAIEGGLEDKKWKYRDALALHKVVEEQLKISKQKLVFVKEKYRLNQVKLLELHEAEEAAQKIEIDLIEQAFKVRQAEFDLYRLIGMFHEK